jgi:hypothetical protein
MLFVPECEFQPIFNSYLGIDFVKMILNHLFGGAEVHRDFAILHAPGDHFDNTELARTRLLEKCVCCQQVPKLGFQILQFDRIRHFGQMSEQLANASLFQAQGQGGGELLLGVIHASDDPAASPQGNNDQCNDEHAGHDGELNPAQPVCPTHKDTSLDASDRELRNWPWSKAPS